MDFGDRWSPMLVKELRQGLRAKWFVGPFLFLHVLVLVAVSVEYIVLTTAVSSGTFWSRSAMQPGIFWISVYIVVAGVMPLRGMESLREESTQANAELLLLGGLSRWQIVRGKWKVQGALTFLTLLSLMPYMLVRYFLGGVELVQNFFTLISVFMTALGMSGVVLGASGYAGLGLRFFIVGFGAVMLGIACVVTEMMIASANGMGRVTDFLMFGYVYAYAVCLHLLFAVIGMQLGRAHLKVYLLPFEINPTRSVLALLFTMPFILVAGGVATCGGGAILVLFLMLYVMCAYDKPYQPTPVRGQNPLHPSQGYPRF